MNDNRVAQYFIIIGPPQNGKSTVSKFLASYTGQKYGSTSDVVYRELAKERNTTVEALKQIPKETLRPALIIKGNQLCNDVKTYLVDSLLNEGITILDGARREKELSDIQAKLSSQGNLVTIWVENPRVPKIKDNTEVTADMADIVIINDSTIEALYAKLITHLTPIFQNQ